MKQDPLPKAITSLGVRRIFRHDDKVYKIACLLREEDWRPLQADWWVGKEVCIIAADLSGDFFLRHCDGSVRYWNHSAQADSKVAASVRDFVTQLEMDDEF